MDFDEMRDRLLSIARDRLRRRAGGYKQLEYEINNTVQGMSLIAAAQLSLPMVYEMGEQMGKPKATLLIQEHLTRVVDDWARRQTISPPVKPLTAGRTTDEATPPAIVLRQQHADKSWINEARERAAAIVKRQRVKDLFPSQEDIADEIAREFRAAGIMGVGGKPLTGASIKRHALKGISSEQGKQLSTRTRRGKWGKNGG